MKEDLIGTARVGHYGNNIKIELIKDARKELKMQFQETRLHTIGFYKVVKPII